MWRPASTPAGWRSERVVSPEPVLTPAISGLARAVADRYAGTLADVLRLAVPPRHARVEAAAPSRPRPPTAPERAGPRRLARYDSGPALLEPCTPAPRAGPSGRRCPADRGPAEWAGRRGRGGRRPRRPGRDARRQGRGPRGRRARRAGRRGRHVVLTADLGPAERYRRWLRVRRGQVRAVVGTRAAMFAPVRDLGLVVVWDDGDDLHAEPRAPYPHAREVLALRATPRAPSARGGRSRTAEGAALVRSGWARPIVAPRDGTRTAAGVRPAGDDPAPRRRRGARLPTLAWRAAHGRWSAALCWSRCRAAATSRAGLRQLPGARPLPGLPRPAGPRRRRRRPACRWCGRRGGLALPVLRRRRLRAKVVGAGRTAEELGRAFPARRSAAAARAAVLAAVGPEPALVVATPGAEPVAEGGYAAALLLDGWALLGRPDLRAAEEALRRWMAAAALVRPGPDGGRWSCSPTPRRPPCRRWCGGTRPASPSASWPSGQRCGCPRRPGWRRYRPAGRAGGLPRRGPAAGGGRGARAGAGRSRARSGCWSGRRGRLARHRRGAQGRRRGTQRAQGRRTGPAPGRPDGDRMSSPEPGGPTTVVFDLGGVLIDWDPRHLYRRLLPEDEVEASLTRSASSLEPRPGRRRQLGRRRRRAGRPIPASAGAASPPTRRGSPRRSAAVDGTVEMLRELHARGHAAARPDQLVGRDLPARPGDLRLPRAVRGRRGLRRGGGGQARPGRLRPAARPLRPRPGRTVFVDDSPVNVEAAAAAGLLALRFTDPDDAARATSAGSGCSTGAGSG